jgi:diguanylate cyclase (GGDEF)-like protein
MAPASPNDFFSQLWKGVWSAAIELSPFGVRVDSYETEGHDFGGQQRVFANLKRKPPAALAIAPAHVSEFDGEIAHLASLGIPVITFHTDAPASKREAYVGTDPARSGALAGELLARLMAGQGTVASFPGALETGHLKLRYLAFRDELKRRAPEIKESVSHAGFSGLGETARRVLESNTPVDGIYVGCSRSYEVAKVLQASGKKIPFVGFDWTPLSQPYLASGTISALIDESAYHQGYLAVQYAYEAIGAPSTDSCVYAPLPASIIMASNSSNPEVAEPGSGCLESLIRARTQRVHRYRQLLDQASSQLVVLSETDPLTGLVNRSKFEEVLAARVKENSRVGLLMIGLDGFERTNSQIGQPVGDEILRAVAKVLRNLSRPQDECARIGGDEFSIVMPGADFAQVAAAREKILAALSKTVIAPRTLNLGIRVSAGLACLPDDAQSAEDLIVRADNSLYAYKRAAAAALARDSRIDPAHGPQGGSNDAFDIRPVRLPA